MYRPEGRAENGLIFKKGAMQEEQKRWLLTVITEKVFRMLVFLFRKKLLFQYVRDDIINFFGIGGLTYEMDGSHAFQFC